MAAGGTVFGLGNCMDVPFLPFGTLHDAKPHYAPARPRAGAVSFAWPTSSAANIHGYSLAYFNLLDACAKQRAAAHGQIDSLAALHCQRGYAVLSLIVRMSATSDLPTLMFPENAPRPVPTTSPTALRSSVAGRQSGCGRWRGSPARRTGTEQRCWRLVTT
jgi:hypothetical protein